jgi:hypothetical protein
VGTRDEVVLVRDEAGCNYIMVSYRRMLLFFSHMLLIDFQPASLIRRKRNLKRRVFLVHGRSLKGNSKEEKKLGESRKERNRR